MCGIIGIYAPKGHIVQDLYDALSTMQHRGQDAAGIATFDGQKYHIKKGDGLVREVFRTKNMQRLQGRVGLGHVRYPTAGVYDAEEAQPFYVNSPFGISLVHNGNLTNCNELREEVRKQNIRCLNTRSDSEILLNVFADEVLKLKTTELSPNKLKKALQSTFKRIKGSYSVILYIAGQGMLVFRDPHGFRPLIFGSKKVGNQKTYLFASESIALDVLGYKIERDIQAGEAIYIDKKTNKLTSFQLTPSQISHCIFEYVYLARPDSIIDEISVYKSRLRMGSHMAEKIKKEKKWNIDVVIPIPDSSRSAAVTLAYELGVKYREGLIKNRYIGRTFIMPGQKMRKDSIRHKLNPLPLEIKGKNVLLVDDSIVRGNTSKKIIDMVRKVGAKNIYFVSYSPPVKYPCVYGLDTPTLEEFIAFKKDTNQICKAIGADGLIYQDVNNLFESVQSGNKKIPSFCMACFNGKYPTKDINQKTIKEFGKNRGCMKIKK